MQSLGSSGSIAVAEDAPKHTQVGRVRWTTVSTYKGHVLGSEEASRKGWR